MVMKRLLWAAAIVALSAGGALAQSSSGAPAMSPGVNPGPTSPDSGTTLPNSGRAGSSGMSGSSSSSGAGMSSGTSSSGMSQNGNMSSSSASGSASMSSSEIKQAQQSLKDQGLYRGSVDGKIGPQTRSAISQFQRKKGLKQTAQLDAQTLDDLSGGAGSGGTGSSGSGSSGGMKQ